MKSQTILWFLSAWLTFGAEVYAALPPVASLIREADETCRKVTSDMGETSPWVSIALVKAKAYSGDYAGAIQTTQSLSDIWQVVALEFCWEIELAQTGEARESIPEVIARSMDTKDEVFRLNCIKMLVDSGKLDEAKKLLPHHDEQRADIFVLTEYYLHLAAYQSRTGDAAGAAANLQRAGGLASRWSKGPARPRLEWLHATLKVWLKLENKERALAISQTAHALVQTNATSVKSEQLAKAWSDVAKLHMLAGSRALARDALRAAARIADAAGPAPDADPEYRNLDLKHQVDCLSEIGTQQFASGFKDDATETYSMGIKRAEKIQDVNQRQSTLLDRLALQCTVGDSEGALKTLESMQDAYWRAIGCCRCAGTLATEGKRSHARQLLKRAESLANNKTALSSKIDVLLKIAEAQATMEDLSQARSTFTNVRDLADAAKESGFRQPMAIAQIRCGLLEDAYETTNAIEELRYRILPLTMLAEHAAKRVAQATR